MYRRDVKRHSIIGALLLHLAFPSQSSAYNPWEHWDVTANALRGAGWTNDAAINRVIDANIATDIPSMTVVTIGPFSLNVGFVFPAAWGQYPAVQDLANTFSQNTSGTNGFHFDDLFTHTEIEERMELLEVWISERVAVMEAEGWGAEQEIEFLIMIGMVFHAIQDFYCHSNYVKLLKEFTGGGPYPTWDELHSNSGGWLDNHPEFDAEAAKNRLKQSNSHLSSCETCPRGGIQTGAWDRKEPQPDPGNPEISKTPWGHRHPEGWERDSTLALCERASREWLEKILSELDPDCLTSLEETIYADNHMPREEIDEPQLEDDLHDGLASVGAFANGAKDVNYIVPRGEVGMALSDSLGTLVGFYGGDHPLPDRIVIGAPGSVDSILGAPDPAARAQLERDQGRLWVVQGGAGSGSLAQSTFIDGTQGGTDCGTPPCWPGIRGDATAHPIGDNFNSPLGDSIVVRLDSAARPDGMGLNWRLGFNARTGNLDIVNAAHNPLLDVPRMLFRLYDPLTRTWSPFDSTELYADQVVIVGADTVIANAAYRMDWPPPDKLPSGTLPAGFTVNGQSSYAALRFLPRGAKVQYTFKSVGIDATVRYGLRHGRPTPPPGTGTFDDSGDQGVDPTRFAVTEPTLFTFAVLPGRLPSGSPGSLLAGRTSTPLLVVDASYLSWETGANPLLDAARGMGVRADLLRIADPGLRRGNGLGGRELPGMVPQRSTNFHPNMAEWALLDSLAVWYRLVVLDTGGQLPATVEDSDASLLRQWLDQSTGTNGGDRGLLLAGENLPSALTGASATPSMLDLASTTGIASAVESWPGAAATRYPTFDDRFSPATAGPGLAPPGTLTYSIDGGTGHGSPADALTPVVMSGVEVSGTYPGANGAISAIAERDPAGDNDRNKALTYAFSAEAVRGTGVVTTSPNFAHSGVENRSRLLGKFLGSVRGPRPPSVTAQCWPCPTPSSLTGNWAVLSGFQTATYGPLYPIQDPLAATGVELEEASAPRVNKLERNYPNPFNPQTTIKFTAAQTGKVTFRIFNVGGQLVRTLTLNAEVGTNEVRWNGKRDDGASLASGIYFYKVKFADGSESWSRMALVK